MTPDLDKKYKFHDKNQNEIIDVALERWRWEAHYSDGTVLKQFDSVEKKFHKYGEIKHAKVREFRMVADGHNPIVVTIPPGAIPIHFYRNTVIHDGLSDPVTVRLYCFGYDLDGHTVLQAILPDDSVISIEA